MFNIFKNDLDVDLENMICKHADDRNIGRWQRLQKAASESENLDKLKHWQKPGRWISTATNGKCYFG